MSELTTMELPKFTGTPGDRLAPAADLPDVTIGVGLADPFDPFDDPFDTLNGIDASAHDPTADIDTSAVGVGAVDGYDDSGYLPADAKAPVYDRHRDADNEDTLDLSGLLGRPAAMADGEAPTPGGPADMGPPPPPYEPPYSGSGDYYGDDDEGGADDPEAAHRLAEEAARVERAFEAVEVAPPAEAPGFSWLASEPAEGPTEAGEPVIQPDVIDEILYGPVKIRGQVFGQDVTAPGFEAPQTKPAPAVIFDQVQQSTEAADAASVAAAEQVVQRAREAGMLGEMAIGPTLPGVPAAEAAPAEPPAAAETVPAAEPAAAEQPPPAEPVELRPAALAEVPTAAELAPELAKDITKSGGPTTEQPLDSAALRQAAALRRFGLASAAGRAVAASMRNGEEGGAHRAEPATAAEPASSESTTEAGGTSIELNITAPGRTPSEAPPPPRITQAGIEVRQEGAQLSAADRALPPMAASPQDYTLSLDEQMLERVIGGLRGATGQAEMSARAEVAGVEVTPEEIAAAGGDPHIAAAEKMRRMEQTGARPAPPSAPASGADAGTERGDAETGNTEAGDEEI